MTTESTSGIECRPFLVIAGMHRSHTSLLGRMLANAGVKFATDQVPATSSNPYGHYEDVEILGILKRILEKNEARWYRNIAQNFDISDSEFDELQAIISERFQNLGPYWAFKIPHATLFLDFWSRWPGAKFVFIVRDPEAVISSLIRRMGNKLYTRPDAPFHFGRAYAIYNERIAHFAKANSNRSYVMSSEALLTEPELVFSDLSVKLDIPIDRNWSPSSLIDRNIVSAKSHKLEHWLSHKISSNPRVVRSYRELLSLAELQRRNRSPGESV